MTEENDSRTRAFPERRGLLYEDVPKECRVKKTNGCFRNKKILTDPSWDVVTNICFFSLTKEGNTLWESIFKL